MQAVHLKERHHHAPIWNPIHAGHRDRPGKHRDSQATEPDCQWRAGQSLDQPVV